MTSSPSASSELPLAACVLLAALSLGCRGDCKERVDTIAWTLDTPGGAALHVAGSTDDEKESVYAEVTGTASNHGDAPCRLALYLHLVEPHPGDLPTLDANTPAPLEIPAQGTLVFETLMPPARDGQALVREIDDDASNASDLVPPDVLSGLRLESDPVDAVTLDVWLTVATCDAPDLEIDLRLVTERCWYLVRPKGSVSHEVLWPEPTQGAGST